MIFFFFFTLCLGPTLQVHLQRSQAQQQEPKAPAGYNPGDGTAAPQELWAFLSRAAGMLRGWQELGR